MTLNVDHYVYYPFQLYAFQIHKLPFHVVINIIGK